MESANTDTFAVEIVAGMLPGAVYDVNALAVPLGVRS